jgi:uncharacterized RDD family membrane protein YckC
MKGKIACYVHANREAVTSCAVCGHRLCAACAVNHNGIDYCDSCAPVGAIRPSLDADYEKIPVLPPERAVPAPFLLRMRAWLVDLMMFVFLGALIGLLLWPFTGQVEWVYSARRGGPWFYTLWLGLIVVGTVYAAVANSMSGQTFGKRLIGVIVLNPEGYILDWQRSALRSLLAVASAIPLGLGYFWILWDKKGETWHDKIARTRVFQYEEVS